MSMTRAGYGASKSKAGSKSFCPIRNRSIKAAVNVITLFSFFFSIIGTDLAWAAARPATTRDKSANISSSSRYKELHVGTFALPEYLGHVKYSWSPDFRTTNHETRTTIIHIQDAHCNYAAQHKISEIIEYLNKEYGIDTINLEGGANDYDLSVFTNIEDKSIRQEVADSFVKEGLVNGAEYYAINNPGKVALWGIEETGLYIDNLNAYRESLKYKEEVDNHLRALSYALTNLKIRIFSKEILGLDTRYSQYKAGNLEFKDYLSYLIRLSKTKAIDIRSYTNVYLLSRTLAEEKNIDFRKADRQRDELVDRLQKRISKKSMEELVVKTVEFKSGRISQKDFYAYLVDRAKKSSVELTDLSDLQNYIAYITTYDAINKMKVMNEVDELEETIKDALYQNDKQKELNKLSKNLALLKNIFNFTLTADDHKYYLKHKEDFNVSNFTSFIDRAVISAQRTADSSGKEPGWKGLSPDGNLTGVGTVPESPIADLDRYRDEFLKFYGYSFKRDDVFLKNIKFTNNESRATNDRPMVSVLITGGFHAESLSEKFKKQDISYISIMPNFNTADGYQCPYFGLLKGEFGKAWNLAGSVYASLAGHALAVADMGTSLGSTVWGEGVDKAKLLAAIRTLSLMDEWNIEDVSGYTVTGADIAFQMKSGPDHIVPIADILSQVGQSFQGEAERALADPALLSMVADIIANSTDSPISRLTAGGPDGSSATRGAADISVDSGAVAVGDAAGDQDEGEQGISTGLRIWAPAFVKQAGPFVALPHKPVNTSNLMESLGFGKEVSDETGILGFNGTTISGSIDLSSQPSAALVKSTGLKPVTAKQMKPCAKAPPSVSGGIEKTVPEAKGRGYIEDGFILVKSDKGKNRFEPATSIHFKGSGKSGFIEMQAESGEGDPTKVWGTYTDEQVAMDLAGEIIARKAGLSVPKTVVLAEWDEFYDEAGKRVKPEEIRAEEQPANIQTRLFILGRAWEDGQRIWDFTASPNRNGVDVGQAIFDIPLPLELYYALKYHGQIQGYARQAVNNYLNKTLSMRKILSRNVRGNGVGYRMSMAQLKSAENKRYEAYLKAMQQQMYDYLIGVIRNRIWLKPHTLHMANISIAGQFSGFDRIEGYADTDEELRSSLTSALIDTYSSFSILQAVLTGKEIGFDAFFNGFQDAVNGAGLEQNLAEVVKASTFREFVDKGIAPSSREFMRLADAYPFSIRNDNDVEELTGSLSRVFSLLAKIYSGEITDVDVLDNAVNDPVHPDLLYGPTARQIYGGGLRSMEGATENLAKIRKNLTRSFKARLFPSEPDQATRGAADMAVDARMSSVRPAASGIAAEALIGIMKFLEAARQNGQALDYANVNLDAGYVTILVSRGFRGGLVLAHDAGLLQEVSELYSEELKKAQENGSQDIAKDIIASLSKQEVLSALPVASGAAEFLGKDVRVGFKDGQYKIGRIRQIMKADDIHGTDDAFMLDEIDDIVRGSRVRFSRVTSITPYTLKSVDMVIDKLAIIGGELIKIQDSKDEEFAEIIETRIMMISKAIEHVKKNELKIARALLFRDIRWFIEVEGLSFGKAGYKNAVESAHKLLSRIAHNDDKEKDDIRERAILLFRWLDRLIINAYCHGDEPELSKKFKDMVDEEKVSVLGELKRLLDERIDKSGLEDQYPLYHDARSIVENKVRAKRSAGGTVPAAASFPDKGADVGQVIPGIPLVGAESDAAMVNSVKAALKALFDDNLGDWVAAIKGLLEKADAYLTGADVPDESDDAPLQKKSKAHLAIRGALGAEGLSRLEQPKMNVTVQLVPHDLKTDAATELLNADKDLINRSYRVASKGIALGCGSRDELKSMTESIVGAAVNAMDDVEDSGLVKEESKALIYVPWNLVADKVDEQGKLVVDKMGQNILDSLTSDKRIRIQLIQPEDKYTDVMTLHELGIQLLDYDRAGDKEPSQSLLSLLAAVAARDIDPMDVLNNMFKSGFILKLRKINLQTLKQAHEAMRLVRQAL